MSLFFISGNPLPMYRFIPSTQGKHYVLLIEGSKFNQTTSNGRYWNCTKRMSSRCKARARFDSHLNMTFYDGYHNHVPVSPPPPLPAAVLPPYNVSAAITQAFSQLAREKEQQPSVYSSSTVQNLLVTQAQTPQVSRENVSQFPVYTSSPPSALNLTTAGISNPRYESGSYS